MASGFVLVMAGTAGPVSADPFIDPTEPFSTTDTLYPPGSGRYDLMVTIPGQLQARVASVSMSVSFPKVDGHPFVRILPHVPDRAVTFERAVHQQDGRVFIQGDVNLDLSGMQYIQVASGVQIIGERCLASEGAAVVHRDVPERAVEHR